MSTTIRLAIGLVCSAAVFLMGMGFRGQVGARTAQSVAQGQVSVLPGRNIPTYIETRMIVVVKAPDINRLMSYSKETGVWRQYEAPKGVRAEPVVTDKVCALFMEGDDIHELVAFR